MDANLRELGIHHEVTKSTKIIDIHNCGVWRREGSGGSGSGGLRLQADYGDRIAGVLLGWIGLIVGDYAI